MEKKEYKVYGNTVTRDLSELAEPTGNIYESTMIIAKRANPIAAEVKQELSAKLRNSQTLQILWRRHSRIGSR